MSDFYGFPAVIRSGEEGVKEADEKSSLSNPHPKKYSEKMKKNVGKTVPTVFLSTRTKKYVHTSLLPPFSLLSVSSSPLAATGEKVIFVANIIPFSSSFFAIPPMCVKLVTHVYDLGAATAMCAMRANSKRDCKKQFVHLEYYIHTQVVKKAPTLGGFSQDTFFITSYIAGVKKCLYVL